MQIFDEQRRLTSEWVSNPCYIFDIIPSYVEQIITRNGQVETDITDFETKDCDLTSQVVFMDNGYVLSSGRLYFTPEQIDRLDSLYQRRVVKESKGVVWWVYERSNPLDYVSYNGHNYKHWSVE